MYDDMLRRIIQREGGYSDHPADRGGPTKYGITMSTLSQWRKRTVTPAEVRELTEQEALEIYRTLYVTKPGFDTEILAEPLREQLIDYGVNSGTAMAIIKLQEILGVEPDGVWGPVTEDALKGRDQAEINKQLVASRIKMIGRIVAQRPTQTVFLSGWLNRALEFL